MVTIDRWFFSVRYPTGNSAGVRAAETTLFCRAPLVLGCRWICLRHQSSRDWWSVCDLIPVIEDSPGTASHAVRGPSYRASQGWFGRTVTDMPTSSSPEAGGRRSCRTAPTAETGSAGASPSPKSPFSEQAFNELPQLQPWLGGRLVRSPDVFARVGRIDRCIVRRPIFQRRLSLVSTHWGTSWIAPGRTAVSAGGISSANQTSLLAC